ncbi:hypothetical protein GMOD_00002546 [Pyrenophora seminiperda CCB06]|uniref:Uncharacterized protein n=1 Tax=Pyrenophora seminiperda CCB06 TaxID=1302712 RepID=A0A3M7M2P7_9PLEO|nr:hypothetical protein GMOD_00002546 [Pyrenophora seminiperda CCB06]
MTVTQTPNFRYGPKPNQTSRLAKPLTHASSAHLSPASFSRTPTSELFDLSNSQNRKNACVSIFHLLVGRLDCQASGREMQLHQHG